MYHLVLGLPFQVTLLYSVAFADVAHAAEVAAKLPHGFAVVIALPPVYLEVPVMKHEDIMRYQRASSVPPVVGDVVLVRPLNQRGQVLALDERVRVRLSGGQEVACRMSDLMRLGGPDTPLV